MRVRVWPGQTDELAPALSSPLKASPSPESALAEALLLFSSSPLLPSCFHQVMFVQPQSMSIVWSLSLALWLNLFLLRLYIFHSANGCAGEGNARGLEACHRHQHREQAAFKGSLIPIFSHEISCEVCLIWRGWFWAWLNTYSDPNIFSTLKDSTVWRRNENRPVACLFWEKMQELNFLFSLTR